MLVYEIIEEKSFDNIAKWLRNIDEVRCHIYMQICSRSPIPLPSPNRYLDLNSCSVAVSFYFKVKQFMLVKCT